MGLLIAPLGPVSEYFYFKDWWQPETFNGWQYGLEDIVFSFLIGSVGGVFYEEIANRQFFNEHKRQHPLAPIGFVVVTIALLFVMTRGFSINSSYASDLIFLALTVYILFRRPDLIRNAVFNGLIVLTLALTAYLLLLQPFPLLFKKYWDLQNFSGLNIGGIPLEELSWFFFWGMIGGVIYEFVMGFGDRRLPVYSKRRKK